MICRICLKHTEEAFNYVRKCLMIAGLKVVVVVGGFGTGWKQVISHVDNWVPLALINFSSFQKLSVHSMRHRPDVEALPVTPNPINHSRFFHRIASEDFSYHLRKRRKFGESYHCAMASHVER